MNYQKQGKCIFISDNTCHILHFLFARKKLILLGENIKRKRTQGRDCLQPTQASLRPAEIRSVWGKTGRSEIRLRGQRSPAGRAKEKGKLVKARLRAPPRPRRCLSFSDHSRRVFPPLFVASANSSWQQTPISVTWACQPGSVTGASTEKAIT